MTAKEFILKKLNECSLFTHKDYPESVFHIWDKQLIRQKKLLRLSGQNNLIDFKPGQNSIVIFEQDYKYGCFHYNYYKITQNLIQNYGVESFEINTLIKDILEDDNKMKSLIPVLTHPKKNGTWDMIIKY